tara:strand:- start:1962 stop:2396 length:435 start_codon:yes stop_codon:yes gene_type:complete
MYVSLESNHQQNNDFRHDLEFGQESEHWFAQLYGRLVEIKTEREIWSYSKKIAVELYDERRGKKTGLNVTESDYQVHVFSDKNGIKYGGFIIPTDLLKELIKDKDVIPMGDADSDGKRSYGVLLEVRDIFLAMVKKCRSNNNNG